MKKLLDDFIQAVQFIGSKNFFWVQGPGGNASVKLSFESESQLWIKATGWRLDQVTLNQGIAKLNYELLKNDFNQTLKKDSVDESGYLHLIKDRKYSLNDSGPSMETGFHVALDRNFVLHFHSLVAIFIYNEYKKDPSKVTEWLKKSVKLKTIFIPYSSPGLELSKHIFKNSTADIYFVENHGVILNIDHLQQLKDYISLEEKFCQDFNLNVLYNYFSKTTEDLLAEFSEFTMPINSYFPDTVVFKEELIQKVLATTSSGSYKLKFPILDSNKSLVEIWLATMVIYKTQSDFPSIDFLYPSNELQNLPTEIERKKSMKD